MISSVVFDTADRIDAEISSVLAAWPDDSAFNARTALEMNGHLSSHSRAIVSFALEEFATRIQDGEHPDAAEFAASFPEVQCELESRLRNLLSLELAGNLLSDAPEIEWPRPGQKIGNFHLVEQLGIGAFSRVYMAFDMLMGNRSVVVKVTKRPADECQLAGPLDHPHLAKLFSVSVDEATGLTVVCMPYFGRLTCDDLRTISPFVPPEKNAPTQNDNSSPVEFIETTIRIMLAVGGGVGHLHSHGIIHRDIKPSNIVLSNQMFPTLVDFNASTAFANSGGIVVGTLPYVAPEILDGIRTGGLPAEAIAPTADIYSLGLVCYEILGGALPFEVSLGGKSTIDALRRSQMTDWIPLRERNPLISRRLAEIICRATAQTADKRFETVGEFCQAMRGELQPLGRIKCRVRCSSKRTKTVAVAGSIVLATAASLPIQSFGPLPNIGGEVPDQQVRRQTERDVGSLDPNTRSAELRAYTLLKLENKTKEWRQNACVEMEALLSAAEERGKLSGASYNNWAFGLIILQRPEDAVPKLQQAMELLPDNTSVLINFVGCEFIRCSTNKRFIPDTIPFERLLELKGEDEPFDAHLLGMGAYCMREAAKRDQTLSSIRREELMSQARRYAKKANKGGATSLLIEILADLIPPSELKSSSGSQPRHNRQNKLVAVLNPLALAQ